MDESVKTRAVRKLCSECGKQYPPSADVCQLDGAALLSLPIIDRGLADCEDLVTVGTVLGDRYEILSVIGTGGMGIVYKARHRLMDRLVAVKMLNRETIADEQLLLRFQQEAKTASLLSHPNIVAVFDYGVFEQMPYLVMDYVEGRSLEDIIGDGPIPLNRYFSIFSQAADALSHAHQKGVIHRDIKPSNIMIESNDIDPNCVRVLDFGIAKLIPRSKNIEDNTDKKITRNGEVVGSAQFMSPEQCMGQEIGPASDIYSLGCVMYEALSGVPAIFGKNTLDTIYKQINDLPLPLQTVRADLDIPEGIAGVVMKALRKDPAKRFATMHELNSALEEAFKPNGVPSITAQLAKPKRLKPPARQMRPLAIATIALTLPIVAVLIYFLSGEGTPKARQLAAALAVQEARHGSKSPRLIPVLTELSAEYVNNNPGDIAAVRVQERLTQLLEANQPRTPALAHAKLALAGLFASRNNAIRAKALRAEALQIMQTYASALKDNAPEKDAALTETAALSQTVNGAQSLEYADSLTAAARYHARVKELSKAQSEYKTAGQIRKKVFGENSDKYADCLEEYGAFCIRARNYPLALDTLQNGLAIREQLHGKESGLAARAHRSLGKLYQEMGRGSEAESSLLAAIASQGAATGPESQEVAPILSDLAAVYLAQHNAKQAQEMYRLAVTIQDNQKNPNRQDLAVALKGLAKALTELGQLPEAKAASERAKALPSGGGK